MSDPFAPNSNSSVLRDAQVGVLLIAVLLGVFVYVAYYRITGKGRQIPEHVRTAPVAQAVWPHGPPENATAVAEIPIVSETVPRVKNRDRDRSQATPNVARSNLKRKESIGMPRAPSVFEAQKSEAINNRIDPRVARATFDQLIPETDPRKSNQSISRAIPTATNRVIPNLKPLPTKSPATPKGGVDEPIRDREPSIKFSSGAEPERTELKDSESTVSIGTKQPNDSPEVKRITATLSRREKVNHEQKKAPNNFFIAPANPFRSKPAYSKPELLSPKPMLRPTQPSKRKAMGKRSKEPSIPTQCDIARLAKPATSTISQPVHAVGRKSDDSASSVERSELGELGIDNQVSSENDAINVRARKTYSTREGDSFWSIAIECYGDGRFFEALYLWNADKVSNFNDLKTGTELEIPKIAELCARWPETCHSDLKETASTGRNVKGDGSEKTNDESEHLYITLEGDTLFEIAAKKLGQASKYFDILMINKKRLPANVSHLSPLKAGLELVLPE